MSKYADLDAAILKWLPTSDWHPVYGGPVRSLAGPKADQLIPSRLQTLRKAGKIRFVPLVHRLPHHRPHGWVVIDG